MIPAGPAQLATDPELLRSAGYAVLGFGLLSALVATVAAFGFRAATTRRLPLGAAAVLSLGAVALWFLGRILADEPVLRGQPLVHEATALYALLTFLLGALAAGVGWRLGDYVARDVYDVAAIPGDGETARLLRSAGLAVEIRLPDRIGDAEGYPAVDEATKRDLAGRTLLFSRRLSTDELTDRLERRIERDFELGHAHATVTDAGAVDRFAVGARRSRLGPSLPPGTAAVAVEADPASEAARGDPVEVWRDDGDGTRLIATGVLRAKLGDVVTVVVEDGDVEAFDRDATCRLTTLPEKPTDVADLVAVVRSVDEAVTAVDVASGGPLEGEFVSWLPATVVVVDRESQPVPFPDDRETLQAGDTAYVLGKPAEMRRLAEYERDLDEDGAARPDPPASRS